jgi:hypothetical protein
MTCLWIVYLVILVVNSLFISDSQKAFSLSIDPKEREKKKTTFFDIEVMHVQPNLFKN